MKLCEDVQYYEETKDVKITYNVSANAITIWVHYDNNWNAERGLKVLNRLVKPQKLDQVGYQLPRQKHVYPAEDWEHKKFTCEYSCLCLTFNFDHNFDFDHWNCHFSKQ